MVIGHWTHQHVWLWLEWSAHCSPPSLSPGTCGFKYLGEILTNISISSNIYVCRYKNNLLNSIILWTFWKGNLAKISWIFLPVLPPITSTNGAHHQTWPFPNRRCVKTLKFVLPNIWFNEKLQTTLLLLWCDGNAGILWGQECAILVPRDCRPGEYLVRNLRA